MKPIIFLSILFWGYRAFTQNATKIELPVKGNCEECKVRIENAADIKGVKSVLWNSKTQRALIEYYPAKTSIQHIRLAISEAGHDTDSTQASPKAYNRLPNCCRYRHTTCEKP